MSVIYHIFQHLHSELQCIRSAHSQYILYKLLKQVLKNNCAQNKSCNNLQKAQTMVSHFNCLAVLQRSRNRYIPNPFLLRNQLKKYMKSHNQILSKTYLLPVKSDFLMQQHGAIAQNITEWLKSVQQIIWLDCCTKQSLQKRRGGMLLL